MAALIALTAAPTARAQTERAGGGASQKIMQQYQQLAAEKTALQTKLAQMQKDLDSAKADAAANKKELTALKAQSGGAAAALAQALAAKQTAELNQEQTKQRTAELVARFREMAVNLREVETDRTKARKELSERNAAFDSCAENNVQLYEVTNEVLNRYQHVGLFTKVSAEEPFTRITKTRIENLVDEYRTHVQELRVQRRPPESDPQKADPSGLRTK
jgi:chromosome segregation ATPase